MPAATSVSQQELVDSDDLRSFTVEEVAQRIRLSPRTVVRLIDEGQLKSLHKRRRGTPVRVTARSLRAYFDRADGV